MEYTCMEYSMFHNSVPIYLFGSSAKSGNGYFPGTDLFAVVIIFFVILFYSFPQQNRRIQAAFFANIFVKICCGKIVVILGASPKKSSQCNWGFRPSTDANNCWSSFKGVVQIFPENGFRCNLTII